MITIKAMLLPDHGTDNNNHKLNNYDMSNDINKPNVHGHSNRKKGWHIASRGTLLTNCGLFAHDAKMKKNGFSEPACYG